MICYSASILVKAGSTTDSKLDSWRGVYPAICTPFGDDDVIDPVAQRRVVRFALECGSHGIVVFGLAGEVLKLSADERRQLTDVIVEEVGGAVPVFVGVGAPSSRASVELARYAEAAGASCVIVPAPMSGAIGADALVDYIVGIASSVSVPVMVQDAPAYLGVGIGVDVVRRIGERAENVRLVKLEVGPAEMSHWIESLGGEFAVWGGDGGMYLLDCMRTGAAGIIPGVDLVDLLVRIYEAELRGERALAEERFREILPMLVFEMQHSIDHYNACAKRVLVQRGVLEHETLRSPAGVLGEVSQMLLEQHLSVLQLAAGGVGVG
jgi:2-keto-3-deoxy-L-arabinonate dehydratase